MNNLSIAPGTNNVGAYINNINLKSLDLSQVREIKNTLVKFGVIFIKKQNLDPESYQNFAKSIGQPVVYPRLKGLDEKFPFINVIERKPDDKNLSFGSSWLHQDTSYLSDDRPRYTMLMGIEIPKGQGNTIFSSGFNAYEKLPNEIKDKIKNATGIFSSAGPISITRREREAEQGIKSSESMEAEHPIVKTVSGKKTLYVSPGHLMKIKNVKEEEADYLKNYLTEHVNKQEFIFSYEWSKGDICLWDNLSILHMASEIKNCKRIMHRITIK
jgi:taurine dioxygenase